MDRVSVPEEQQMKLTVVAATGRIGRQVLEQALAAVNTPGRRYELSLSLGLAHCTAGRPASVEELVEQAGASMREARARRSHRRGPWRTGPAGIWADRA
jgi:GGDEF domain-containing protein